jgi:hypothetical protein
MGQATVAVWVGQAPAREARGGDPRDLLKRSADEVLECASPVDALDALLTRGERRPPARRLLFVVDLRRTDGVRWRWIELLVRLDLGPVIALVDSATARQSADLQRAGVSRCFEGKHLARHPELLVRAARRALGAPAHPKAARART